MDSFHRKKLQCQREEANEQNHYTVAIVTEQLGVLRIKVRSWPWANRQHVYLFSKVHDGNIECTLIGARHYSSISPLGRLEVPCTDLYTALFIVMQKLGRYYKLGTSKYINIDGI